jgi:hypothetical protein
MQSDEKEDSVGRVQTGTSPISAGIRDGSPEYHPKSCVNASVSGYCDNVEGTNFFAF